MGLIMNLLSIKEGLLKSQKTVKYAFVTYTRDLRHRRCIYFREGVLEEATRMAEFV